MAINTVLAFETSCDDTSVAVVRRDGRVLAVATANQDLAHEPFGGIVPEVAGRNHTLAILPLVERVFEKANLDWDDIDGIAVTSRPGLVTALLVGLVTAKTLALAKNKPFIGVNHIEGHLLAGFLHDEEHESSSGFEFPFVGLAVSGGHTHLYECHKLGEYRLLGQTIDDAAGEAFDKFAKLVGLGFPGGAAVDREAKSGNAKAIRFPRPQAPGELDFSFSGLKTAAIRWIEENGLEQTKSQRSDLCASYTEAIVDVLIEKLALAMKKTGLNRAIITGGVSANSRLRDVAATWAKKNGVQLVVPPLRYCTDNAAMIGYVGAARMIAGESATWDLGPSPHSLSTDFVGGR